MLLKTDKEADIIPDNSLGGIKLRLNINDIENKLKPISTEEYNSEIVNLSPPIINPNFTSDYFIDDLPIRISIDNRNNKIFRVTAYEGYKGKLFGEIFVGMIVENALIAYPDLYYNEGEEVILCKGKDGLSIALPIDDPLPNELPPLHIYAISVFASETYSLKGFEGNW